MAITRKSDVTTGLATYTNEFDTGTWLNSTTPDALFDFVQDADNCLIGLMNEAGVPFPIADEVMEVANYTAFRAIDNPKV